MRSAIIFFAAVAIATCLTSDGSAYATPTSRALANGGYHRSLLFDAARLARRNDMAWDKDTGAWYSGNLYNDPKTGDWLTKPNWFSVFNRSYSSIPTEAETPMPSTPPPEQPVCPAIDMAH
ncbi:hypothetical protein THASP1DRAFT_25693 [Thamnocephalis sphaerospora]|uniref:Uncharacterized protein n=1 Tax=Thamnocephalis sphaerospora TaxID=78915 RepID=A0A4P9XJJ5_9FUNG|nr:hypothetical protein THASP1DRAFT_25693 [Thamnocephalis sphaerospora]|eukprot:RKP05886.1 hypothetical protein THASP1DRAFT_25693 [Thamnocephalis sphaerospora]